MMSSRAGMAAVALVLGAAQLVWVASAQGAEPAKAQAGGKTKGKAKAKGNAKTSAKGKADAATAAKEEAEDRQAPAQFNWTARPRSEGDMDARADQKRDEAIEKLKVLVSKVDGDQKAELWFRLAEMYGTKAKYLQLRTMELYDQMLQQWHEQGAQGRQPTDDAIPEREQGKLFQREAYKLYSKILDTFPAYPRKDEVLYNLGNALYEAGEKNEGVQHYWTLIKQYPNSDFVADAWLQLGEHFFNANKIAQASKAYARALETNKPRIYSYALYKLGWCDFNLQEYESALGRFKSVVEYAKRVQAGASTGDIDQRDRIQLMQEALQDMVRTYSHLDAVDEAVEYYLAEVGEEKAYKYLHKLAGLYNEEGKHSTEIKMYTELNNRYPYRPEAPQNQTAIMNAYAQLGRRDDVRREVRRLIDLYSPTGIWAQHNAANAQVQEQAFDVVEQELANLVTEQHREAQQTKLVSTYKLARDIYKEYLDKFTQTENAYAFRFFYAEILYELQEYAEAAAQYDLVVQADTKGKYVKPAAWAAILTWEKVVGGAQEAQLSDKDKIQEPKDRRKTGKLKELERLTELQKGKSYEPTPLSEPEINLAAAYDRFVEVVPDDPEVVKVKFKSARLHYIHNQFEPAAERFGEIIDRWPNDELARLGAESIVQSFNVRNDWTNLNQWARKFQGNKKLMGDREFAKAINNYVEGASFNEVHFVYEPKGDVKDTADRYAAFVAEFPTSKYALVALYNSIVSYDKSNLLERAMAQAEHLLKQYKGFTLSADDAAKGQEEGNTLPRPEMIREKVLFLAASFHERLAKFDVAASYYEQFAAEFPKAELRADALFNAGLFREGLGELDAAIRNFQTYVKDYPQKPDVADITWRIGLVLERKGDHKASAAHFAAFARAFRGDAARALCAEYKVIQSTLKQGKEKEARAGYQAIIDGYKKLKDDERLQPCPLEAVAHAAFSLLEPEFEAYRAITLTGSEKVMAKNLLTKLELVDKLQKSYTEVLALGHGDYGIAALYRIGQIYQQLAQQIFATPCPKNLDEDQCMIYEAALQEKAFPLEEKAIEAYDSALKKAYELGLYNDWLAKTTEALKTYEPARFPRVHNYELIASEQAFDVPTLAEVYQ